MKLGFSKTHMVIFVLVLSFFTGYGESEIQVDVTVDQTQDLSGLVKVLNYNTLEAGINSEWKEIIRQENPDIILQVETGSIDNLEPWKNELNSFFPDELPYDVVGYDGSERTDGQAIYSRFPIIEINLIESAPLDDGTMYKLNHPIIGAVIDVHGVDIQIFANHLSCCTSLANRLFEQESFINYMDSLGDVPILYGGDFNSDSHQDVGDIASLQGNQGNEPIQMMIDPNHPKAPQVHQFTDTYRELNPDRKGYTLNHEGDYQSIDYLRARIDYIFVNQHLTNFMVNSSVVTDYPEVVTASDHKPMYTWFNFNATEIDLRPPLNPTNVTLSDIRANSSTISWDANLDSDLFKYSVYRNGSLLSDVLGDKTIFVDNHQYNGSATYIYQVTATDMENNEGQLSLPVFLKGGFGELFAPYDVTILAYPAGGIMGVNWSISGLSSLPLSQIKVFKASNPENTYVVASFSNESSVTIDVPPIITLYVKISVVNAIGESEMTNFTYIGDPTPSRNEIQPDRANVHEYSSLLDNLVADHTNPVTTLEVPPETSGVESTSEISDTTRLNTDTHTSPTTLLSGTTMTGETEVRVVSVLSALTIFVLVTTGKRKLLRFG